MLYLDRVTIKRMTTLPGNKRVATDLEGTIACKIIPMDDVKSSQLNFTIGKNYELFTYVTSDIKTSDKVIESDGTVYNVKAVQKYKNAGEVSHIRCLIEVQGDV